jgi:hypothetical protein
LADGVGYTVGIDRDRLNLSGDVDGERTIGDRGTNIRPHGHFVRGDSDSSGGVDLTDGVVTLNFLFDGGPAPACMDAADAGNNGSLGLADAIVIFNFLFARGQAPSPPSPSTTNYTPEDCGPDSFLGFPVLDGLDCAMPAEKCR